MSSTRINKVLANEQESLWCDLFRELRSAVNGEWSIGCENRAWRIWLIAREIGPTEWTKIPPALLYSGVYQTLVNRMGYPDQPVDLDWFLSDYAHYVHAYGRAKKEIMNMELEELDDDN